MQARRRLQAAFATALLLASSVAGAQATGTWAGAYQDMSLGPAPAWRLPPAPGRVALWAFATGECGKESWGAQDRPEYVPGLIQQAVAQGRDYVVSTGGEAGIFTCSSEAGMRRFVERHLSPRLVGLDFDIEGKQTPAQITALVQQVAWAAKQWPQLRLSFTLATHASADGRGLNATGETVMSALTEAGLHRRAVINLMVMNYGPADARWCVVKDGRCDMATSALAGRAQPAPAPRRAHGADRTDLDAGRKRRRRQRDTARRRRRSGPGRARPEAGRRAPLVAGA